MNIDPKKTIFLIDGSSFLYRAYYGVRPLHTPEGVPVQAVFSFCRMIKKLIDTFGPEYLVIVWDSKGKTTRHEMYQEYKATRQAPPSDIFDQKKIIVEFADLIGIKQITKEGIEADDIMYSIAKEQREKGNHIVFITSDKDMAQALDDHTIMYDPLKDEKIDPEQFEKKYGFPVTKLPFYYALLGDTSDNIPGVRGIGKKGAADLVRHFDSLEDLYAQLDRVKSVRTKMALESSKDKAFLSRDLFLLQYHPTGLQLNELMFDRSQWNNARPLFEQLNFKSLLKDIDSSATSQVQPTREKLAQYTFKAITTRQELDELCLALKTKKKFALDTETNGELPLQCVCVGISVCFEKGTAYYIPFGHTTGQAQLATQEVVQALKPIFEDEQYEKYLHHAKFDQLVLYTLGINLKGVVFDTVVAARLVVREWQRIGLKELSEHYFSEPMITFKEVVKDNGFKTFDQVPLDLATRYAAADAHQTYKLVPLLQEQLKEQQQEKLYYEIEHPLINVLAEMEIKGIGLDVPFLNNLNKYVTQELDVIHETIIGLVGQKYAGINLNSPKQIEQLLFHELQLPPQKKSAKGTGHSTDQEVLQALSHLHPVPGLIMAYRELFKLKSTYIEALPTFVNPKDDKVHTSYSQTVVATGRLSSFDPNLQNVPVDGTGYGIEIRAAFKADPGHVFLSADYSQIELRVLAELSQDQTLIDAFLSGHDIHRETAARLFDVGLDQVTNEQRQIGKRINFSILYGLTPYGLSKDLGIPLKEAKNYIDKYFAQYPGVARWMDDVVAFAQKHGYVTTYWGRRRYIPTINEKNPALFREGQRVAINTVAQGTAAEIMKIGMLILDPIVRQKGAAMLLQIHDELLISVPEHLKEGLEQEIKASLEAVVQWRVPLEVSTRLGKSWKDVSK